MFSDSYEYSTGCLGYTGQLKLDSYGLVVTCYFTLWELSWSWSDLKIGINVFGTQLSEAMQHISQWLGEREMHTEKDYVREPFIE